MTEHSFRAQLLAAADRARISVPDAAIPQLFIYFQLLQQWNRKINLTSLDLDPLTDESLNRLFLEPLVAAADMADSAIRWFDLGSGGGSPAIPLRTVKPSAILTMVEVRERKAAFLRHVVRELGWDDVMVSAARYEDVSIAQRSRADVVTVRAVRGDAGLFRAVEALVRIGGRVLWFRAPGSQTLPDGFELAAVQSIPSGEIAVLSRMFHVEQSR